ncbi:GTP pyrophosphokinase [Megasphaera sp. UBA4233]|uniref:GTP pyrophosphokinase n=1 Tax=Megasphaera sp. UBA4233 TaxID=1946847 RepID=UPI000EDC705E|nr:GTP pyrophosphokinase family protein [Megasphaera sp. UBA4233]HAM04918.1 GTP pyrophosphokinase [Megasphaera sp.]
METDIYGIYRTSLEQVMDTLVREIRAYSEREKARTGSTIYEHLLYRIKTDSSMRGKCDRKGLPQTERSALYDIHDAIGLRIVCRFIDDIYTNINYLRQLPQVEVVEEKDYVRHAKPNGYRSYHLILAVTTPFIDVLGHNPGRYFAEIQLRTLAMDSWASLEHEMKYKKHIQNPEMISRELKRCADELASCDLSMQTIRNLIRADNTGGKS